VGKIIGRIHSNLNHNAMFPWMIYGNIFLNGWSSEMYRVWLFAVMSSGPAVCVMAWLQEGFDAGRQFMGWYSSKINHTAY